MRDFYFFPLFFWGFFGGGGIEDLQLLHLAGWMWFIQYPLSLNQHYKGWTVELKLLWFWGEEIPPIPSLLLSSIACLCFIASLFGMNIHRLHLRIFTRSSRFGCFNLIVSMTKIVVFHADAKKQFQQFATQTLASHVTSTISSAFSVV